jgi:hypothetical protein
MIPAEIARQIGATVTCEVFHPHVLNYLGSLVPEAVATTVRNAVASTYRRCHDRRCRGSRRDQSPELVAFERFSSLLFWKRPGLGFECPELPYCIRLLSRFASLSLCCFPSLSLSCFASVFLRHGEFASFENYCRRSSAYAYALLA